MQTLILTNIFNHFLMCIFSQVKMAIIIVV